MNISKRLKTIASFINQGDILADIGSDHAYLPCYLVSMGICEKAYACDVVDGPIQAAKENVAYYGYQDKVEVIKGNGLAPLQGKEFDVIAIAGMGGALISQILNAHIDIMNQAQYMVLQPNSSERNLREFLFKQNWYIKKEILMEEGNRYYEILLVSKEKQIYSCSKEDAILFGPCLLLEKSELFTLKWQQEYDNINKIMNQINDKNNEKYILLENKAKQIKKVL